MSRPAAAAALVVAALLARPAAGAGETPPSQSVTVTAGRMAMGTVLEISLVAGDAPRAAAALEKLFALAAHLDRLLTTYEPESPLNRLSAAAGQGPQAVDPALAGILAESLAYARRTGGAFDVSVGPLVDLWREAARRDRPPDDAELAQALARVGSDKIRVEGTRVELASPGMRLDLGAIAKGWALDRMREILAQEGVGDALVNFGQSSILALGRPADAPAWTMALRGGGGELAGVLELRDRAFSVSGSLGQWSEIGGRRYGHVIDPRSGLALTRNRQAAVVAPSASQAEAWSTALVVLGPEGLALLEGEPEVEAWLQEEGGASHATAGWERSVRFEALP